MKRSPFNSLKIYRYFFIAFILLLGISAIYVSCKSKSPTDANAASNDALAAQGAQNTTQTTTSSSTTTSVKPGQSPTNTTTLITSRTLTSTSTRTTTTSSSTTTTSRKPTTTIPTTIPTTVPTTIPTTVPTTSVVGNCKVEWCWVKVTINDGTPTEVQNEGGINVNPGDVVKISISVKNTGTAATDINTNFVAYAETNPPSSFIYVYTQEILGAIPADNTCYTWSDAFQISVLNSANSEDSATVLIYIYPIDCNYIFFAFVLNVQ